MSNSSQAASFREYRIETLALDATSEKAYFDVQIENVEETKKS